MTTTGPGNYTKYSNPEVDALVAKMLDEDDASAQKDLDQIQEILMAAPNWIPIAEYATQWGTRDNISGTSFHPEDQLRWFDLKKGEDQSTSAPPSSRGAAESDSEVRPDRTLSGAGGICSRWEKRSISLRTGRTSGTAVICRPSPRSGQATRSSSTCQRL